MPPNFLINRDSEDEQNSAYVSADPPYKKITHTGDTALHCTALYCYHYTVAVHYPKGHHPSADLRYGKKDSISASTLVLAAIKG